MLAMEAGGVIEALATGPAFPNLLVSLLDLWLDSTDGYPKQPFFYRSVSIVTSTHSSAVTRAEALCNRLFQVMHVAHAATPEVTTAQPQGTDDLI